VLKLTCSNEEFQKFSHLGPTSRAEKGSQKGEREGKGEGRDRGRGGKGMRMDCPATIFGLEVALDSNSVQAPNNAR